MTEQQKTRNLATKVMGWKSNPVYGPDGHVVAVSWGAKCSRGFADTIEWNPFTRRDDAHELLAKLTDEQWDKLAHVLYTVLIDMGAQAYGNSLRQNLTATPAQIAEAVWRATCQK